MAQRSRQAVNRHPCNPRDLEQLHLPALLLWDSRYSNSDQMLLPLWSPFQHLCSPSLMGHGSPRPASLLNYSNSLFNVHGIFDDGCLLPSSWKDNYSLYQHPREAEQFWILLSKECAVIEIFDI